MRCSALAEQLDEPMIGTVDQRARWLLVEDRSAWGHDAVADVLGAPLAAALKEKGIRALLVRHREGDPAADALRRVILVDTVTREMAVRTIASVEELDALALASGSIADFGTPLDGPIFLVCSNGKRDACCAVRGRALLNALAVQHAERTWECTHLGGHRFAANLVCLPDGLVYGRVTPSEGPRLADAYLAGRIEPGALRGRSAWPAPAQVAEQHVRMSDGFVGIGDIRLVSADVGQDRAEVILATPAATRAVVLRAEPMSPPRPTSCRADEIDEPVHWQVMETGA
ncbi:MAG: sucrase ferredoxin [Candidatus Limnocylindria bacterium]